MTDQLRTALERAQKLLFHVNVCIGEDRVPFFGDDEHELLNDIATAIAAASESNWTYAKQYGTRSGGTHG